METVDKDGSEANLAALERAIQAAHSARVLPSLRVKARKLIERVAQTDRCVKHAEDSLERATKQLKEVHGACHESNPKDKRHRSRNLVARQLREDVLIRELQQTMGKAAALDVSKVLVQKAEGAIKEVERYRRLDSVAAARLKGLLLIEDAQALGERFQLARTECDLTSESAQKILSEIQDRVSELATQEQHQQWLDAELVAAAEQLDVFRLQQLLGQAKMLGLRVCPSRVALLHNLEASQARQDREGKKGSSRSTNPDALAARRCEAAEDDAPLQKRLGCLEQQGRERLHAEQEIQGFLHAAGRPRRRDGILRDDQQVELLRAALHRADLLKADPEIVYAGMELLEKSVETADQRRRAEDLVHQVVLRPLCSDAELDVLQLAIEEGKRCGINTLHASKELASARDRLAHREAAEAELQEAAKGFGSQARVRLEAAVQAAKTAGVAVERLRSATARLSELNRHEERCSLVAGDLRRALPFIQSEPWRFQRIMDAAQSIQPRTAELQALVEDGEKRLKKTLEAEVQHREAQRELQTILQQIKERHASGTTCVDHPAKLSQFIERAKAANVERALISEAEEQLCVLRRRGSQRLAAEHRLRLALSARRKGELERALLQVHALDCASAHKAAGAALAAGGATSSRAGGGSEQIEAARSARLLEAADSTLRQLGDVAARRAAATAALRGLSTASAGGAQDADAWLRKAAEALREARQTGVAPTLVEQARLRVRETKHASLEETRAREALQRSISKDMPTPVVMRNLRRLERLQAARQEGHRPQSGGGSGVE